MKLVLVNIIAQILPVSDMKDLHHVGWFHLKPLLFVVEQFLFRSVSPLIYVEQFSFAHDHTLFDCKLTFVWQFLCSDGKLFSIKGGNRHECMTFILPLIDAVINLLSRQINLAMLVDDTQTMYTAVQVRQQLLCVAHFRFRSMPKCSAVNPVGTF